MFFPPNVCTTIFRNECIKSFVETNIGFMRSVTIDHKTLDQVPVIVMLRKTFDYIRVMCAQYWPASLHREEEYCDPDSDGFWVTVKEELHYASYIHRRMLLRRGTEQRQVVQKLLH